MQSVLSIFFAFCLTSLRVRLYGWSKKYSQGLVSVGFVGLNSLKTFGNELRSNIGIRWDVIDVIKHPT